MLLNVQDRVFLNDYDSLIIYGSYLEIFLHSSNVANIAAEIGDVIGLSSTKKCSLHTLALYHDLGKIKIPGSILNKQERLTHNEWQVMEEHAVYSQEIYLKARKQTKGNFENSLVLRHHHENWDGSGYPDKISGEDIPMFSRIIRIADVFDAITQPRIYRTFKIKNAVEIMKEMKGKELDPHLLEKSFNTLDKLLECRIKRNAKNWDTEKI